MSPKLGMSSDKDQIIVAVLSDFNYLSRCALFLDSARAFNSAFVLALDDKVSALSQHFPQVRIVQLEAFLKSRPEVKKSLVGRSWPEQIFTLGPNFLRYLIKEVAPGGWLVYADSDLYFYEPLDEYLGKFPDANVVLSEHRHHPWNRERLSKYGQFNVGLVAFRNNSEGLRALDFWADSCLDWCFDVPRDGKYADQKYLESFSIVSTGVQTDHSPGSNFAPWNSDCKPLSCNQDGLLEVDGKPLSYFHAQGIKLIRGYWVLAHLNYFSLAGPRLKKFVYQPYLQRLEDWSKKPGFKEFGTSRKPQSSLARIRTTFLVLLSFLLQQTVKFGKADTGKPS